MISTGSYPYQSGIPINHWFDVSTGKRRYCVEESAESMGPGTLVGTTFGDELKNAGYDSRIVSLALKDRAAILLGGKRPDYSIWLDQKSFQWTTSRHDSSGILPPWVQDQNKKLKAKQGQVYRWVGTASSGTGLSLPISGEFKHQTIWGSNESLSLPAGLEITTDLAESALKTLKLGRGKATDVLMMSYSSHDYLGHQYGPNTREMEEMVKAEDKILSRLFRTLNKQVGLNKTLIVLTADHGVAPSPSYLQSVGVEAGKLSEEILLKKIETRLNEEFGKPQNGKWIADAIDFNFYLNPSVLAEKKIQKSVVEAVAKKALSELPQAAFVFTSTDYAEKKLPPGMVGRQILKTYYPGRSGDVILIAKPFYITGDDNVSHMTGYAYDRTVPLILRGPRIKKGEYATSPDVVDLAPTLSYLLGTIPPALSEGRILREAIE